MRTIQNPSFKAMLTTNIDRAVSSLCLSADAEAQRLIEVFPPAFATAFAELRDDVIRAALKRGMAVQIG